MDGAEVYSLKCTGITLYLFPASSRQFRVGTTADEPSRLKGKRLQNSVPVRGSYLQIREIPTKPMRAKGL
jgi:hypothetical protein